MKKNTVGGLLMALCLGAVLTANAQTPEQRAKIVSHYDLPKLRAMAAEYRAQAEAEKAEAVRLAEINGWPLTITEKDGTFKELKNVRNGKPAYYTTYNEGSAKTSRVDKINSGGSANLDLNGEDMIIGEWDGGRVKLTHQDLTGRVTQVDNSPANDNHATHVAGTMISSGDNDSAAQGMAPEAYLWAHDWNADTAEMIEAAAEGLLISNHSYGIDTDVFQVYEFGAYLGESAQWDNITHDAPYYQPVVAAGNDRDHIPAYNPTKSGRDLLTLQAVSKNVVVVAAVDEVFNFTPPLNVGMSDFSNWGPTDDRRIKPDICAKGVGVYSTIAGPDNSNSSYDSYNGTSMASPGVAGTLLLLQQHYNDVNDDFMLSATLRGLMAHTADDANAPLGPDFKTGWGLINAEAAAAAITNNGNTSIISELNVEEDDTYELTVVANGLEPIKVTVSWTDPAATPYNGASIDGGPDVLKNNIDVRLIKTSTEDVYYPWRLNTSFITSGAQQNDNNVDNIEKIELPSVGGVVPIPAAGTAYKIVVTGENFTSGNDQDFSLIVTGITFDPNGLEDEMLSKIEMYPNPADDMLNFSFGDAAGEDVDIAVYDVQGRKVAGKKVAGNSFESIDISHISTGVYFVEITKGDAKTSKKLIKK